MSPSTTWSIRDIGGLSGKTAVVTGANNGLGFETTRALAHHGAHVVLACRDTARANGAVARLRADVPGASAEVVALDLSMLSSVRAFATEFRSRHASLDLLVNNAGIMMTPRALTADGFELQFGTNHLGHFALTGLLLDPLLATAGSRVVTLSSLAHRTGTMDFGNLMFEHGGYSPMAAYARSKLANLLFTHELQRRFTAAGAGTIAVAAHPGVAGTDLFAHVLAGPLMVPLRFLFNLAVQSPAQGARSVLRAATDPRVDGGSYYGPGRLRGQRGAPVVAHPSPLARDAGAARRLWAVSCDLTGVDYAALRPSRHEDAGPGTGERTGEDAGEGDGQGDGQDAGPGGNPG